MRNYRWAAFLTAVILGGTVLAGTTFAGTAEPESATAAEEIRTDTEQVSADIDMAGPAAERDATDLIDPGTDEERKENFGYHRLADFTAETLDGGTFTPDDLKQYDLTIVYFWSGTCGYCVEELPELAELKKDLPSNIQLITWCPDGGVYHDTVVKMLDRRGLDAVTIIGGEEDIDLLIKQLLYTPMALFLDKDGNMLHEPLIGAPDDTIAVYNEIIDEIFDQLGIEREETEE